MQDLQQFISNIADSLVAFGSDMLSAWLLVQLAMISLALALAIASSSVIRRHLDLTALTMGWPPVLRLLTRAVVDNLGTIIFVVLTWTARATMMTLTWPSRSYLIGVAASLASAWVVIAIVTMLIRNQFVYRLVAVSAWTIAALSILGLLEPVTDALNSMALIVGGVRITPLLILKTTVLLLVALWAASSVSNFLELRVRGSSDLTPSMQELVTKLIRASFIAFAVLVVLSSVGIDLSSLAVVGGAIGVGVGLGLQKIVSNFVSGIILLVDKSIKPGDVISVGDGIGWVTAMNARYTSVSTRDGREVLIPNEDLVTQRVINWSYSRNEIRRDIAFSSDLNADPHRVCVVALNTVKSIPGVLEEPAPLCDFVSFSNKQLDFVVRIWVEGPLSSAGQTAVLLALWDAFRREGIGIPTAVQDVRLTEKPAALRGQPEAGHA